jgi:hypothetical protein
MLDLQRFAAQVLGDSAKRRGHPKAWTYGRRGTGPHLGQQATGGG